MIPKSGNRFSDKIDAQTRILKMLPDQKLNALVTRHAALERDLTAPLPPRPM